MRIHQRLTVTPEVIELSRRLARADHVTRYNLSKRIISLPNLEIVYEDRGCYLKLDTIRKGSCVQHFLAFTCYVEDAEPYEEIIAALCLYTEHSTILVGEDYIHVPEAARPKPIRQEKRKGFLASFFKLSA